MKKRNGASIVIRRRNTKLAAAVAAVIFLLVGGVFLFVLTSDSDLAFRMRSGTGFYTSSHHNSIFARNSWTIDSHALTSGKLRTVAASDEGILSRLYIDADIGEGELSLKIEGNGVTEEIDLAGNEIPEEYTLEQFQAEKVRLTVTHGKGMDINVQMRWE